MKRINANILLSSIFVVFLLIGLVGLFTPYEQNFRKLSFFNLIFTFSLVLISMKSNLSQFIKLFFSIFILGYLAELIGVHSGFIFGEYAYGDNLGLKLFDVPLVIGINWAVLSIGAWFLSSIFFKNTTIRIVIGSLFMLIFDIMMEPTAIDLEYWKWKYDVIPLFNYVSWFVISLPALYLCSKFQLANSGITKTVFISQFIFFFILSFRILWF